MVDHRALDPGSGAVAAGERPRRVVAIALPTGIVGDHEDRIADVRAAAHAVPTLFVAGDRDPLCELGRIRGWIEGAKAARLDVLPGVTHFPAGPDLDDLLARAVAFLRA
jgi:pimeloyl-ACP methyl ester carboxylesterase